MDADPETTLRWRRLPWLATCVLGFALAQPAAAEDDAYLAGYAAATIERDLGLEVVELEVDGGVARVVLRNLGSESPYRVSEALVRIEGIERAEVRVEGQGPEPLAEATLEQQPEPDDLVILPSRELFEPLLADPRQPHFSASYLWYRDDSQLTHAGSANFGETFALLGGRLGDELQWELGLLGAVFSLFDLDAESLDLINSDFWVASTFSLRSGGLSGQLRLYHQSSHLGDEFLLRTQPRRINLSYEGVDLLVSADLHPALRVYLGGGVIVHDEPDLHPLSVQGGLELLSPIAFLDGKVRPLSAADFQFSEEGDWRENIALAGGIQIENPKLLSKLRLQVLFEYFRGNSPNGQFYDRRIEYMGLGVHLHL